MQLFVDIYTKFIPTLISLLNFVGLYPNILALFTLMFGQSQLFVYIQSKQKQTTYQTVNKDVLSTKWGHINIEWRLKARCDSPLGRKKLFLCLARLSGFLKSERIFCHTVEISLWLNRKKILLVLYSLFPFPKKSFSPEDKKNILTDFSWANLFD